MEINGTWYAIRTIDSVGKIYNSSTVNFDVVLIVGGQFRLEALKFKSGSEAEQSRKQLIEQLNK